MLESFRGRLAKLLRSNSSETGEYITEEIKEMVKEGHEHGVLKAYEAQMVENIMEFTDLEAQDQFEGRVGIDAGGYTFAFSGLSGEHRQYYRIAVFERRHALSRKENLRRLADQRYSRTAAQGGLYSGDQKFDDADHKYANEKVADGDRSG